MLNFLDLNKRDRDIVGQRHCDGQLCVLVWPEICGTCLTLGDSGPGNLVTRPVRGGTMPGYCEHVNRQEGTDTAGIKPLKSVFGMSRILTHN